MKKLILVFLFTFLSSPAWATVPNATPLYNQYNCNSSTTQFPYAFQISATSDMQVYVNNNAGTITQEPLSSYSVDTSNVWVNYPLVGAPCPSGSTITLQASTPQTQTLSLTSRSPFVATAIGGALDKLTLIDQQLQGQINRAILAPAGTSAFTFPSSVPSNLLGWDPAGSGNITNFVPNTGAYLNKASTADAQTATDNTKYMTPSLVATEVAYSGAVSIPVANLSGTLTTAQGGTGATANANAASGVVVLNGSAQLPAVDGSLLTNIPVETTWADYLSTSIITGWSATPTGNIKYKKIGKTVFIQFSITGTSNSTSTSFTLPYAQASVTNALKTACISVDNSGSSVAAYFILTSSSSTVTAYATAAGGSWTASGTKSIDGEFWYQTS